MILLLVLANGIFAMAEMAVVSARKARLRQMAEDQQGGAAAALALAENPHEFLSTVQIGITLIGTLAGAFGGATLAEELQASLQRVPALAPYAESIAITTVVVIAYLSLILGELVPKNVALSNPERIAKRVARPMTWLAKLAGPAVRFLTASTHLILKLLPVNTNREEIVTEDEVKVLIAEGTEHGTFEPAEQEMVEGVFRLADRRIVEVMQSRSHVAALDLRKDWTANRALLARAQYSRYPVIDGDLDRIVGVVHVKDLLAAAGTAGAVPPLRNLARRPLVVPEMMSALEVLKRLQKAGEQMAVIVDEHGAVQGIATLAGLMQAVLGELGDPDPAGQSGAVRREDGSWLVDGALPIPDFLRALDLRRVPGEQDGFTTVGGLLLAHLHRIPAAGDQLVVDGWRFEVIDMDRNRIDKVLVSRVEPEGSPRR